MFHSLETTGYKLYNALSDKAWVTLVFILIYSQISQAFKVYLLLLAVYSLLVVFLSKNLIEALSWIFLTTVFFPRYKFFSYALNLPINFNEALGQDRQLTFFSSFADAVLLVFSYFLFTRRKRLFGKNNLQLEHFLLLVLLSIGVVSSFFADYALYSLLFVYQLLKGFFILLVYRGLIVNKQIKLNGLFEMITLFVGFNAVLILLQSLNGGPLGLEVEGVFGFRQFGDYTDELIRFYRPGGMTTSPNEMATVIGMFAPLFVIVALAKKSYFKKNLSVAAALLSLLAVFLSMARAIWVSLAAVLVFDFWFIYKRKVELEIPKFVRRYKYLFLSVLVVLFPLFIIRLWSLRETFFSEAGGLVYRLRHLKIAYDYMNQHLFGVGLNNMQFKMALDYSPEFFLNDLTPAHNILAQIGASFGFIGLISWTGFFYLIVRRGLALLKKLKENIKLLITLGVFSACIMYLLVSQFHPWLIKKPIFYFFYLTTAILFSLEEQHDQKFTEKD